MVRYKFNCLYCNNTWIRDFYSIPDNEELKCPNCQDKNIKKFKVEFEDKYGYNIGRKKDKKKYDF